MSRFDKNTLRPEEQYGGFEADAEQDDTFMLERLPDYPGNLERFVPADMQRVNENAAPIEAESAEISPVTESVAPVSEPLKAESAPAKKAYPYATPSAKPQPAQTEVRREKNTIWPWLAAALVLLALGAGGWWVFKNSLQSKPQLALKKDSLRVTTENGVAPEIVIVDTAGMVAGENDSLKSDSANNISVNVIENVAPNGVLAENRASEKVLKNTNETAAINPDAANERLTVKQNDAAIRNEVQPKVTEPVLKKAENGVYTVQVYSSPSRADAEEMVARLRQKNAGNAVVTSQKIRGQEWYRVRFGNYPTRSDAEDAALKLGFAQSWIVQIR
jgi:septal ring-binding cell division protein DamX